MLDKLVEIIRGGDNIVAFTGAGVSTESGIPDFRSSGGLYEKIRLKYGYQPEYLLSRSFFNAHPDTFYDYYRKYLVYREAMPNDCHKALASLEDTGKLKTVITQNIDGLQQAAGSKSVVELHGTVHVNTCIGCGKKFGLDYIMDAIEDIPHCNICGGIIKPDVVLYEEQLNPKVMRRAAGFIASAGILLVMGTSLAVYPAAGLIDYYRGQELILINKTPTAYDTRACIVINDSAGKIMSHIVGRLKG